VFAKVLKKNDTASYNLIIMVFVADMVLLDKDIFTVNPDEIKDILPVMTMVGGQIVFKR